MSEVFPAAYWSVPPLKVITVGDVVVPTVTVLAPKLANVEKLSVPPLKIVGPV